MKRLLACLLAAFIVAGLGAPVVAAAATKPPPKVVLVVGPVGPDKTARLRAQADEAARIARRYTPDVVKVYSPNATWPVVRKALDGASLVVYMGHGNGWPSRYRDELYPPTQNGFGLNPVAGGGDSKHQYFGEALVGSDIELAKDAVVLLHHLCYASGNTEPGLPEGTFGQAKLRVDNYAAGFIRAGASAVIAEALSSPAYNVRAILAGGRSIDRIWRNAPTANGNFLAFASNRSPGYVAQMDPERSRSRYHRSIVLREGLAAADVLAGARGSATSPGSTETEAEVPTLIGTGIKISDPTVRFTTAGTTVSLRLPYAIKDRDRLPKGIQASVRWDPIDVTPVALDPANEDPPAEPVASASAEPAEPTASGGPDASSSASVDPAASDAPSAAIAGGQSTSNVAPRRAQPRPAPAHEPLLPPLPPDTFTLMQPERLGDVVQPAKVAIKKKHLAVRVALPANPGLYRLTVTLHDENGVAYDAATQARVPSMLTRVVGEVDGKVLAALEATLEAATDVPLAVRIVNLGRAPWGREEVGDGSSPDGGIPSQAARLIGHWIPLATSASAGGMAPVGTALPAGLEGGSTAEVTILLTVPAEPGQYLLVLDVVTPGSGSLAALGVAPTMVRVTVVPQP